MARSGKRAALLALGAVVVLAIAGAGWVVSSARIRAVYEGEIYRTAQPDPARLERAFEKLGIRTVLNLRGENRRAEWFRAEAEVCRRHRVELISLPFETFDWPPQIETRTFVEALDRAKRPILIHCESGVDRSAWAATTVRLLRGEPLEIIEREMSPLRGHFCNRETCRLHAFFDDYREWSVSKRRAHSAAAFREWVMTRYAPGMYDAAIHVREQNAVSVKAGSELVFEVEVQNRSKESWTATSDRRRGVRLGARILGPFAQPPADPLAMFRVARSPARDVFRDGRNQTIAPGEKRLIEVRFAAPANPGTYYVQFDMVDEFVHWFSDLGGPGAIIRLEVVK